MTNAENQTTTTADPAWASEARRQIANLVYNSYGQQDHNRTCAIADAVMPAVRTAVSTALAEAVEAARGEYLQDATGTPEDEAYNQAVSDVVAAIGALLEGK